TNNALYKAGADVSHRKLPNIHKSGHASQEEQKLMLRPVQPKYFMPIRRAYRKLDLHMKQANSRGVNEEHIRVFELGDVLDLTRDSARFSHRVTAGTVFVDGNGIGDIGNIVLRDRKSLSEEGLAIVVLTIDFEAGELLSGPDIISRGF